MFLVSLINYQALLERSHWFYIAAVVALLLVALFGKKYLGARRWIQMPGGQHFQPSEWVKLILILAMAKYFHDLRQREASVTDLIKASLIVVVPFLLVLKQPDLGTALTYLPVLAMAMVLGGLRLKHGIIIMLVLGLAMPLAFSHLKPYQKARLTSFLDPEADSQGAGYQLEQSLIAVGSGGLTGRGFTKGSHTQGLFLSVPHTDFIFAAFAEERGFVGAITLLLLYFLV